MAPCGSFCFAGLVLGSGRPGPRLCPLAAAGRSAGPGLFGAHRRTVQRPDGTVRQPDGAADRHGGGRPEGYTRATVRARLRVETADGEAAAFCCQCDGLPLCGAGETIEAGSAWKPPRRQTGPAATPMGWPCWRSTSGGSGAWGRPRFPGLVGPAAGAAQRGAVPGAGRRRGRRPGRHDRGGPHPYHPRAEQRVPGGGGFPMCWWSAGCT